MKYIVASRNNNITLNSIINAYSLDCNLFCISMKSFKYTREIELLYLSYYSYLLSSIAKGLRFLDPNRKI